MARIDAPSPRCRPSYGTDLHAQHRQDRRADPRGRGQGRPGRSCRPSCSRGPISAWRRRSAGSPTRIPGASTRASTALAPLAAELGVVIPVSIFEKRGPALLQQPGDDRRRRRAAWASTARATSPTAPATRRSTTSGPATPASGSGTRGSARIGVGICWDQWFPEAARAMTLMGAEVLLYPTAIGSEPHDSDARHRRALAPRDAGPRGLQRDAGGRRQPHRLEPWDGYPNGGQDFYGSSFIADHRGDLVADFGREDEGVLTRQLRPGLPRPGTARPGASSATAARTSTAR